MPTGKCICGKVKYEYSGEPMNKLLCHCLQCRAITSSAFNVVIALSTEQLKIIGSPKHYELTHESGELIVTTFCGDCGSFIGKELPNGRFKGTFLLAGGTLDAGLDGVKPNAEIWIKHRASWLPELSGIPQAMEFPG